MVVIVAAGPGPARGACGVGQAVMAPSPWRTASGCVAAASDQAVADFEEDPVYAARGPPPTPLPIGAPANRAIGRGRGSRTLRPARDELLDAPCACRSPNG